MSTRPTLAVLGAGSWGTALAALAARNGVPTRLWGRDAQALAAMAQTHRNQRYLPDLELPPELRYEADLAAALKGAEVVLVVVPSHAFASILDEIAPLLEDGAAIAWASKGFEPGTGRFLHELVAEKLPGRAAAVVTGPSFAKEVAAGLPSAVTVHSDDEAFAQTLAGMLHAPNFRAYTGSDVLGAELGGAMKNVLAVATGVADGMRMGLNARAGLITRGIAEMMRLGAALGARIETLMGLAGLGDLTLSCTSTQSRNYRFGVLLGAGESRDSILASGLGLAEGVATAPAALHLAEQLGIDAPLLGAVKQLLAGRAGIAEIVGGLMARPLKRED